MWGCGEKKVISKYYFEYLKDIDAPELKPSLDALEAEEKVNIGVRQLLNDIYEQMRDIGDEPPASLEVLKVVSQFIVFFFPLLSHFLHLPACKHQPDTHNTHNTLQMYALVFFLCVCVLMNFCVVELGVGVADELVPCVIIAQFSSRRCDKVSDTQQYNS